MALGALAAGVVTVGLVAGWRGVDLPAQLYRVGLFRREGFALWDSQWFGGHWLLDYSVLFPAVAASIGVGLLAVLSAAAATIAFDRLIVWQFGATARLASLTFAVGAAVQSAIGQLPFLSGEAAGLCCMVAIVRGRWLLAAGCALAATLVSPLPGAFTALGVAALWVARTGLVRRRCSASSRVSASDPTPGLAVRVRHLLLPPDGIRGVRGHIAVLLAAAVPVVVTSLLFPGQGPMPYPLVDYLWELMVVAALWLLTPHDQKTLRVGMMLYAAAATASEAFATPLGGNIGRLEDLLALPLAVAVLWPRRRLLLGVIAVPLALSQWTPAWAAITTNAGQAWTHAAYYRPLDSWLAHRRGPVGRTEVVPTADHWEAAYVAPWVPLARGWERQLDVADNPIFYQPGALTAASYRAWLLDNGVRYVALASAPLDSAGVREGALVAHGVPGLSEAWRSANWTVYRVVGSAGIVGPGARLVRLDGSRLTVDVTRPGPVVIRVRWTPAWQVTSGKATTSEAPGRWLRLAAASPGVVELRIRLF